MVKAIINRESFKFVFCEFLFVNFIIKSIIKMNKQPIIVPITAGIKLNSFKWLELSIAGSKSPKKDAEIIIPAEKPLTIELNFNDVWFLKKKIRLEPIMVAIKGIKMPRVISIILFMFFPLNKN